jgi:glyoxalase family protein
MGVGAVHHVAWRVEDDDAQVAALGILRGEGLRATDVQDRQYFRSIYFREPGGVLFEVATDSPGFGVDEGEDDLGSSLRLPPWLEGDRQSIESNLPVVSVRT